jgi:hypothetical protein
MAAGNCTVRSFIAGTATCIKRIMLSTPQILPEDALLVSHETKKKAHATLIANKTWKQMQKR